MQYTNKQIAEQIGKILQELTKSDESSFENGVLTYNGKDYVIPNNNSPKRNTPLIKR